MVCRNPDLADQRARKRETLLATTERALEKVKQTVQRSEAKTRKTATRRTSDVPVHSFQTLLDNLATLGLNTISLPSSPGYRFDQSTTPTRLQAPPFELFGISP